MSSIRLSIGKSVVDSRVVTQRVREENGGGIRGGEVDGVLIEHTKLCFSAADTHNLDADGNTYSITPDHFQHRTRAPLRSGTIPSQTTIAHLKSLLGHTMILP